MITFKTIKYQNLLSVGNAGVEVDLQKSPSTLIVGRNGSAKSSLIDAICFALFNKPYRNINKPQLVNSINGKKLLVELEFDTGGKQYKIVRGIKPNVFEIYENGEMIDQDAASKDYQEYLEKTVLKMNFESFTQIVVLGTANFIPFMQLKPAERRDIIEELLDIKIFSQMSQALKERVATNKSQLSSATQQIDFAKQKAKMQTEYIEKRKGDRDDRLKSLVKRRMEITEDIKGLKKEITKAEEQQDELIQQIVDKESVCEHVDELQSQVFINRNTIVDLEKETAFYNKNAKCPKCKQEIDEAFKAKTIKEFQKKTNQAAKEMTKAEGELTEARAEKKRLTDIETSANALKTEIATKRGQIKTMERMIDTLRNEYEEIESEMVSLESEQEKLQKMADEALTLLTQKGILVEDQLYLEIASTLLKDSGIKTRVVKQYLPAINSLVNKYLSAMDFYVQFTIDEKFDENIKSRYRDSFSYESFSEGEKQRIDLALLFTWRSIAKAKNSTNTNLLILDEVFDSSLDVDGTEHVMSLLKELSEDTNVFVISHRGDILKDKFNSLITVEKKKDFSTLTQH